MLPPLGDPWEVNFQGYEGTAPFSLWAVVAAQLAATFAWLLFCFLCSSIAVHFGLVSSRDREFMNLLATIALTMSGRVHLRDSFLVGSMDASCEPTLRLH